MTGAGLNKRIMEYKGNWCMVRELTFNLHLHTVSLKQRLWTWVVYIIIITCKGDYRMSNFIAEEGAFNTMIIIAKVKTGQKIRFQYY